MTKRTQEERRTDQHIPWVTWSYACDYRQMFMLPSNKRIQVWSHEEMWKAEWVYRAPTLHSEVQSVGSNPTFTAQGGCWPHEGRHRVRWPRQLVLKWREAPHTKGAWGLPGWATGLTGLASGMASWAWGLAGWAGGLAGWAGGLAGWTWGLTGWAGWANKQTDGKYSHSTVLCSHWAAA